jgi:hypothetical protein
VAAAAAFWARLFAEWKPAWYFALTARTPGIHVGLAFASSGSALMTLAP